jgi:spore coat polysaccharide biosynthesis protein SpsF
VILAILQARSSSSRFPGKVLAPLHDEPMIVQQIRRIARSKAIDQLVLATSTDPSDDLLSDVVEAIGVDVYRGPLDDVVERFSVVIDQLDPTHVVRLTADCPLADPAVIDKVVSAHLTAGVDYTSNVHPPTFPDGLDAEVFTKEAFRKLRSTPLSLAEREHVTLGFHRAHGEFSKLNVEQTPSQADLRWTVDIPEDLAFVEAVYERLHEKKQAFTQADVLQLLDASPGLSRTSASLSRNSALREG